MVIKTKPARSPEPWQKVLLGVLDSDGAVVVATVGQDIRLDLASANVDRIVACVNACQGIDDPAAELARLREIETDCDWVLTLPEGHLGRSSAPEIGFVFTVERPSRQPGFLPQSESFWGPTPRDAVLAYRARRLAQMLEIPDLDTPVRNFGHPGWYL